MQLFDAITDVDPRWKEAAATRPGRAAHSTTTNTEVKNMLGKERSLFMVCTIVRPLRSSFLLNHGSPANGLMPPD